MYNIVDVAKFFKDKDYNIGLRKMYYLVYYAWSWYIYIYGYELFIDSSIIQPYGVIYYDLKGSWCDGTLINGKNIANDDIVVFLNKIYDSYGNLSTTELKALFTNELPYLNAKEKRLDIENVINEYKAR